VSVGPYRLGRTAGRSAARGHDRTRRTPGRAGSVVARRGGAVARVLGEGDQDVLHAGVAGALGGGRVTGDDRPDDRVVRDVVLLQRAARGADARAQGRREVQVEVHQDLVVRGGDDRHVEVQ